MEDNQSLNPDAIYAGMAWLREHAESFVGRRSVSILLEKKQAKVNALRALANEVGGDCHIRPVFEVSDEMIEEIFPGESVSVECGIELGRSAIWGPPAFATAILQGTHSEDAPIREAMRRFIADRAN